MSCCKSIEKEITNICPNCKTVGETVKVTTIKNILIKDIPLKSSNFSICLTSSCNIAYFGDKETILTKQIKEIVYTKSTNPDKILCYCSRTTEKEILDYVDSTNNTSIKDIVKNTAAMNNSNCELNSPTGRCCSKQINDSIKNHLGKNA